MKYGEYAPDVQLILRKSNSDVNKNQPNVLNRTRANGALNSAADQFVNNRSHDSGSNSNNNNNNSNNGHSTSESNESPEVLKRNRDIRKSLTFSGLHGTVSDHSEVHFLLIF